MDSEGAKWIFLWRPVHVTPLRAFGEAARSEIAGRLGGCGASEVILHLTEEPPPRLTLVPYRRSRLALISVRGSQAALAKARDGLATLPGSIAGWRVDEAIPVPRRRTWPTGARAPGACLLTLFHKSKKLDRAAFFREWYEHHTPLSLKIHPLWCYVRNAVAEPVLAGSPHWDGIVCESFAQRGDLLHHHRLFGGPDLSALRAPLNMIRVGLHVSKFLDLRTIENYLVEEYCLISP
jgi:hypothetical protein